MAGVVLMREESLDRRHPFPDELVIGRAYLHLVDDPAFDVIWKGDPLLGWEGDLRLAVYMCITRKTWELVRYEANGTYTSCSRIAAGTYAAPAMVGMWIGFLLTHDGRRGYDPVVDTDQHYAKRDKAEDAAFTEKLAEDTQPRLAHALRKDGVDEVWGGRWSLNGILDKIKPGPTEAIA